MYNLNFSQTTSKVLTHSCILSSIIVKSTLTQRLTYLSLSVSDAAKRDVLQKNCKSVPIVDVQVASLIHSPVITPLTSNILRCVSVVVH